MKKLYVVLTILCATVSVFGQTTKKGINYQAVIMDPKQIDVPGVAITGQPLSNGNVCVKFSIAKKGILEYEETQQTKTDEYGLVNLTIGKGVITSQSKNSTFDSIIWDTNTANLTVSVSFDACKTYEEVSNQAFNYMPYAFYAEAVEYANVRNAPKNLSEFNNDVGFITKKDLKPLSDSLKNHITETNQKFVVVNQDISAIKNDISNIKSDVSNLYSNVNNINGQINNINGQVNNLNGQVNNLNNITNNHTNQINNLNNTTNNLSNQINSINNQFNSLGGTYEVKTNKSTATDLGGTNTSDTNYPSQKAVKTYVDQLVSGVGVDLSSKANINSPEFTGTPKLPGTTIAVTQGMNDNSTAIATTAFVQNAIATGVGDATTTFKGKIKLAGDLSGTADSPTVPGLALKENGANKSTDPNLGSSNELYPTQGAVKSYVDNRLLNASVSDATNTSKGKIQLGGDIAGSNDAAAPLITPGAVSTGKLADGAVSTAKLANNAVTNDKIAAGAVKNNSIGEAISITNGGTGATTASQALTNLGAEPIINKTTDLIADANSDTKFPSAKAVKTFVEQQILSTVPNASNTSLGKIQLAGDIAGSDSATAPRITPGAITSGKLAEGAVTNTKIANGAVTTNAIADGAIVNSKIGEAISIQKGGTGATNAAQALTNLGGESITNKSTNIQIDGSTDSKYPSTMAVKNYVDSQLATAIASGAPDATINTTGKVRLAGDLGGDGTTANAPVISNNAITAPKLATNSVSTSKIVDDAVTDAKIHDVSGSKVTGDISGKASNVTGVVAVGNGGTGNAATLTGYVIGHGTQPMTSTPTIPVADVTGAQLTDNLSTLATLGGTATSDVLYPSQKAVKTYVDGLISSTGGTTQISLNGKEDVANKSTDPLLGNSNVLYPSQSAVKLYVDNKLAGNNVINNLTGLPNIANNTILGNTSGATHTPLEIATIGSGNVVLNTSPNINTPTLSNPVLNGSITGTAIVPVNQGGSGANMSNTQGYIKQASIGANYTTIAKIPVTDVDQAVRTVNGVQPDANGNVPITIGRVTTGILSARPNTGNNNGDFYVVSNDGVNNGLTYVWDGTTWQEVTPNQAATDARYVNVTGDNMQGDLTFPTGKRVIIADAPASATDAANKSYVDSQVAAATPDATTSSTGKVQLAGDLTGTASAPLIGANKVSFDKIQQVAANVVLGANSAGNVQALSTIPVATLPAFVGDVTTSAGSNSTSIGDKKVTYAKIQDLSGQNKLLGSGQNSGLTVTEISIGNGLTMNGNVLESSGVWNGSTVQVPFGGTGATSLTGYVKGNGTAAMTASATIPVADVTNAETNLNKSTATDLGGNTPSDVMYSSQKAVKTYVDAVVSSGIANGAPNATTLATGKVQLAGDLGGDGTTAAAPIITAGAINTTKLADGAVTEIKILNGAVSNSKIAPDAITSDKIKDGEVKTADLADGAVSNTKIGADAVTSDKILDGTVLSADLANAAITNNKLANDAVTNDKIANGTIDLTTKVTGVLPILNGGTGASTAAGALTNLGAEAVANKVTDFSNPSNSTYPSTLAVQNLVAAATPDATTLVKGKIKLDGDLSGTADLPRVKDDAITSAKISNGTILSEDIQAGAVQTANIADAAVTTSKLANDAVTTDKIKDGTVATIDIANNAVTGDKIADLTITTSKIGAGAVTNDKIAGPISIANGGTNATNVADARSNLEAEFIGNKAIDLSLLNNTLYPTTKAVSDFVANQISSTVVHATNQVYGVIKLAGDLSGDAGTPTVADNAITTNKISNGAITNAKLGETISVEKGGTGAVTLTGYVKGNGTSAMTASSTIPVADVVGAQLASNLTTNLTTDGASDVKYPSAKAVNDYITNRFQADNGATISSGKVELGGALTKATSITTSASNTLAIAGLQTGSEDNNTVVVDANGVLKSLPPSQRLRSQIITVSSDYVVSATDYTILANASVGNILLTLPDPAQNVGRFLIVRKTDETLNLLSFDSAIKISTTSSFQNINMNVTVRIQSDGTNWFKID